ncbi:hypothetical protein BU15DRAFT_56635 [Melanogaster broomeanus]|nr:hypothetical protein BU15DRAFT_56635 [Melanogaster broomeanus]
MPGWSLVNSSPAEGRTFRRPLGISEAAFQWDCVFNGTANTIQHIQLRLLNQTDAYIFSESNITRTWVSAKRRYPLLGARVEVVNEEPHFTVQEHRLGGLNPNEVVFGEVSSAEEVERRVFQIMDGPPLSLSPDNLLARIYIFRETDRTDVIHMVTVIAHCITDAAGTYSFLRCFLDTLSSRSELPISDLEQRLAMVVAPADLRPEPSLSPARQRWRHAIGRAIHQVKTAKRQGGYTLPCRLTRSTSRVPALARVRSLGLSRDQTTAIMTNCRLNNITFGNAFLPLAQVAMTRVLYRRYLRGEIDEEEWQHRKKQPYISEGPFNLRSYLDKQWFHKGGAGEFIISSSNFFYHLPFMTLGVTAQQRRDEIILSNGAPPFANLLTFSRFLHRVGMVKQQISNFLSHPLLYEMSSPLERLERTRTGALEWSKNVEGRTTADDAEVLALADFPGTVVAHGGSSTGDIDQILPGEYPLRSTNPLSPRSNIPHPAKAGYAIPEIPDTTEDEPKIVVEDSRALLHARPAELYLGAATRHKQLDVHAFYDENVFEEAVVREWLDEVKDAAMWYLRSITCC